MAKTPFVDFKAVKAAITMEQVLGHYGILDKFKRGTDSLSGPCPIHRGSNSTQFRISISNPGGPFTLTLAPDNTLRGSGSTTVNGRIFASMDNSGNVSFRPVSATCSVNTFTSKSPAEYRALITNPPAPGR